MAEQTQRTLRVAKKEFRVFFASPAAYLFLAAFLAVTLFVFFWVETYFARNIADVRPLFQWLPILLIFLVSALTMRAWSEERRAGTLESLLTAPTRPLALVMGKFLAALGLVAVALTLTIPLPITAAVLGQLDWGPVVGGYVATLFLAASYVSIGLAMSARTDNPIVALILTVAVCSAFYLIGWPTLTGLFNRDVADVLALIGTGTRFESIQRGVLDLRDLYYYVSIVGIFLALNLFTLERLRWAGNPSAARHRSWGMLLALAALNFAAANFWLQPINWARVDITRDHTYSLSGATRDTLVELREPLLIRGYFSAKTHPLLAPLVPQIRDLMQEYAVAAKGHARVEFIDPQKDPALEAEAASKYGIRPMPLQTATRYQAAVLNSYFNIVVSYGDQYEVLGYGDLVETRVHGDEKVDIGLKNPEYAVTRAIRKVVNEYQSGGNPFDALPTAVTFHGYLSPEDRLPPPLRKARTDLLTVLEELQQKGGDKLKVSFEDPDAEGGKLGQDLKQRFGFGPQVANLDDPKPFWFYMVLQRGSETVQVQVPDSLDKEGLKRSVDAALRKLAPGFLKTVALMTPNPELDRSAKRYDQIRQMLGQNVRVTETELANGYKPDDADVLLVLSPEKMDDKQRFGLDQYLMQGGSVVLATSPYDVKIAQSIVAEKHTSGLKEWLTHYGLDLGESMVFDERNMPLPVPVIRQVGDYQMREIRMVPYPLFPDLRGDSINEKSPITDNLGQLTLNWASPITVDPEKNRGRTVTELLKSSAHSWTGDGMRVLPDFQKYPEAGFAGPSGETRPHVLAVAMEGRFDSFYQGKPSPLMGKEEKPEPKKKDKDLDTSMAEPDAPPPVRARGVIDHSPETAKLVVIASNTFASDIAIDFASQGIGTLYTKPLEFLQNAIDWSLEDRGLLALRGRTQLARTLVPLDEKGQSRWEYANYGFALLGLFIVWAWRRRIAAVDRKRYARILAEVA